jgi:predicted enzyme related to lactoylglutathione lyase
LMALPTEDPAGRSFWSVYFVVDDADEALEVAIANGGRVVMPPMDVADVGRFGFLLDPQGAMFAVIRLELPAA